MLAAMEVPPQDRGGNTLFLNAYAAYDALPDSYKRRLSGKTIKQGNIVDTAMKLRPGASLHDDIRYTPGPSHPIISTHPETGCKTSAPSPVFSGKMCRDQGLVENNR